MAAETPQTVATTGLGMDAQRDVVNCIIGQRGETVTD